MGIEGKYINAIATELVREDNWSPVQPDGGIHQIVLAKLDGDQLKLVMMAEPGTVSYINSYLVSLPTYMARINCSHAHITIIYVHSTECTTCPLKVVDTTGSVKVKEVLVNLEEGTITGESLEGHLEEVLNRYLDRRVLERHRCVDLYAVKHKSRRASPVITYTLILVNLALWTIMSLAGGSTDTDVLIRFGAMYAPLLIKGEYWRLITPIFLHVGVAHLAFNSYALYQLGSLAEIVYGRIRYIAIYIIAGMWGSLFSFLFTRAVSAGASGAIFGLLGALLYFGRKKQGVFNKGFTGNIIAIIAINLFIGFSYPGIDNFAHIGGLIGGYLSALFLGTDKRVRFTLRQYAYAAATVLLIVCVLAVGIRIFSEDNRVMYYVARQYIEEGDYREAEDILVGLIEELPEGNSLGIEARYLYAYSRARQGDFQRAIEYAEIVVRKHPDSYNARLFLGALYLNVGEKEKAARHLREAIRINPAGREAKELLEKT